MNYRDKSLTAIAVTTHEIGHAIQHHDNEQNLPLYTGIAGSAIDQVTLPVERDASFGNALLF